MKTSYLLVAGSLLTTSVRAQHQPASTPPEAVRQAFARAQPQATHVAWHQRQATYEATFRQHERRGVVRLDATGAVLESRLDVDYSIFPPLARTTMGQRFPHHHIDRVTRVVNAAGTTSYVALVCKGKDKNGKDKDCQTGVFDENGRPLATQP